MAPGGLVACFSGLILCAAVIWVPTMSLNVGSQTSKSNRTTKYSSSTLPPSNASTEPAPTDSTKVSTYRFKSNDGHTCILMQTDAIIDVTFPYHKEIDGESEYVPDVSKPGVVITGNCKEDNEATLAISWVGHYLKWKFVKTPGGDKWYLKDLELRIETNIKHYVHVANYGRYIHLRNSATLIVTPLGNSYKCDEKEFTLVPDEGETSPPGISAKLLLRDFQVQPFMYKGEFFGPPTDCSLLAKFRDETAPIAVGSTLALAVLLTIAGYAGFRYFKVKKVQYNTMG